MNREAFPSDFILSFRRSLSQFLFCLLFNLFYFSLSLSPSLSLLSLKYSSSLFSPSLSIQFVHFYHFPVILYPSYSSPVWIFLVCSETSVSHCCASLYRAPYLSVYLLSLLFHSSSFTRPVFTVRPSFFYFHASIMLSCWTSLVSSNKAAF